MGRRQPGSRRDSGVPGDEPVGSERPRTKTAMKHDDRSWLPLRSSTSVPKRTSAGARLPRYFLTAFVLILGFTVAGAVYSTVKQNEELRLERDFETLVQERIHSVAKTMNAYMQNVLATHALFEASEFVTREEFKRFVTPLLKQQSGIRALEWIPRVRKSEASAYRQAARDDGYNFRIRPVGNGVQPAGKATSDSYPVFYVEPYESNEAAFGVDLGTEFARSQALESAKDTAQLTATAPLDLVQDPERAKSTLIFMPRYREEPPGEDIGRRRELLAGFVLAVIRLPDLLRDALADLDQRDVDVALYYEEAIVAGRAFPSHSEGPQPLPRASRLASIETLEMGGRYWSIHCVPTPQFLSSRGTVRPLLVLLAGFALTILGAGYLYASMRGADISRALAQSELRYRTLVEHAPEAILLISVDQGGFVDVNDNACKMFGLSRDELLHSSLIDISAPVQPDGQLMEVAAKAYIQQALDGHSPVFVWAHIDSQGREFPCEVRLVRMPSSEDTLVRGSITDITERVQGEERKTLMMRELDHRVKNNLATVLALTEQSAADASTVSELRSSLAGRIRAIASLHSALASKRWADMNLTEVFEITFAPYKRGVSSDRIRFSGPPCAVPPDTCAALCMIAHELATNAAKYGALSQVGGHVDVVWGLESGGISIDWTESGGPTIKRPLHTGYGMRLITGLVEHQLGGRIDTTYPSGGLHCRMYIPLKVHGFTEDRSTLT